MFCKKTGINSVEHMLEFGLQFIIFSLNSVSWVVSFCLQKICVDWYKNRNIALFSASSAKYSNYETRDWNVY